MEPSTRVSGTGPPQTKHPSERREKSHSFTKVIKKISVYDKAWVYKIRGILVVSGALPGSLKGAIIKLSKFKPFIQYPCVVWARQCGTQTRGRQQQRDLGREHKRRTTQSTVIRIQEIGVSEPEHGGNGDKGELGTCGSRKPDWRQGGERVRSKRGTQEGGVERKEMVEREEQTVHMSPDSQGQVDAEGSSTTVLEGCGLRQVLTPVGIYMR
ncbi:hypothetical protein NDU88_011790 [Pleurodeles waltl]|uniref:Uncharacterized protein n=1 Tax=Pleurodeles waltl TaxID=8319 RepID=A0AAV7R2Q1_PLEWA|nr:hypothetical protein NDU88_011790 [Pleurodeles waltl]